MKSIALEVYYLCLPFRRKFSHATAAREETETLVSRLVLEDGTFGYGEGLPRTYVTGETISSALQAIETILIPLLAGFNPKNFGHVLEFADNLPFFDQDNRVINSARCGIELAVLDAYSHAFHHKLDNLSGWLGSAALAQNRIESLPASGVLGSDPAKVGRQLRLLRWYGLRDFKVKLGTPHDDTILEAIMPQLDSGLDRDYYTLRADANGAWDVDAAVAMSNKLANLGFCCLEQPLAVDDRSHWQTLADLSGMPIMADESLVTMKDGEYLAENDLVDHFNIRISKNGGLLAAIRLADLGMCYRRGFQLGAMVGESAILAAAGLRFLQLVPGTSFTEICYSTFLLKKDLATHSLRFGYKGRLPKLKPYGLGVEISPRRLNQFLVRPVYRFPLA